MSWHIVVTTLDGKVVDEYGLVPDSVYGDNVGVEYRFPQRLIPGSYLVTVEPEVSQNCYQEQCLEDLR